MILSKPQVKKLIENKDYAGLNQLLSNSPTLANEGITIPYDFLCVTVAHPLHRICDGVFTGKLTDAEAIKLAKIFLDHGANIDGDKYKNEGTPLLAAASLHAEQVGIFYIDQGADVHYTFKNDGATALHWASFCGLDKLVKRLITANAYVDEPDREHKSTPLGWAIHSLQSKDKMNMHNQEECIKLLLMSGADIKNLNKEKIEFLFTLTKDNIELENLLNLNQGS